ncbi:MAG: serine hydrolase [Bacillus sp. (in: firmicutes)]
MKLQEIHNQLQEQLQNLSGEYAYMISEEEESIAYHAEMIFPSTSTIGLPLLLETCHRCEQGLLHLNQMVGFKDECRVDGTGVLHALDVSLLSLRDLLTLMITVNDYTATNIIIDLIKASDFQAFSLLHTYLNRKMMDFEQIRRGNDNTTCAADLHHCLKLIKEADFFNKSSKRSMLHMLKQQQFKNKLPHFMKQGCIDVANKTGQLVGIEHDCGIFTCGERTVYAVVLSKDLSCNDDGIHFIQHVGRLINEYLK